MKQKSVMTAQQHFAQVPKANIPRSTFNRSHGYKSTIDPGILYPILCDEVLPGDTFKVNTSIMARILTLEKPILDNMHMETFYFFVPNRLVWENWKRFMGERDPDPDSSIDYEVPEVNNPAGGWDEDTLGGYFGIPYGNFSSDVTALPFRSYNLIWNSWFRDENLQDSVTVNVDAGPDAATDYALLRRGKRHDYFTSCLTDAQKGDAVELPLGTEAPVVGNGMAMGWDNGTNDFAMYTNASEFVLGAPGIYGDDVGDAVTPANLAADVAIGLTTDGDNSGIIADLSTATAATINQLREAFAIQKVLERDSRSGSRYIELIRAHFGVTSPDFRLQRPEYLGGGYAPINIAAVPQTSETNTTPQGTLAAYGTADSRGNGFTKSFTEHGYVIGLICIRADLNYQQGLAKHWSKRDRYDYYLPAFAYLGEQPVLSKEVYMDGSGTSTTGDNAVFGYQEAWAEYRYKQSIITGHLNSLAATPLDNWHLAQEFGSRPELNAAFIQEDPPIDRVTAVSGSPYFLIDCYHSMLCTRPMPTYSVPGMIDHL